MVMYRVHVLKHLRGKDMLSMRFLDQEKTVTAVEGQCNIKFVRRVTTGIAAQTDPFTFGLRITPNIAAPPAVTSEMNSRE